jgi:hypothetical protein
MGIVELIIVVLLLLWLFGYFGRGRLGTGSVLSGNAIHTLLVIVVILVILRLLNII